MRDLINKIENSSIEEKKQFLDLLDELKVDVEEYVEQEYLRYEKEKKEEKESRKAFFKRQYYIDVYKKCPDCKTMLSLPSGEVNQLENFTFCKSCNVNLKNKA